MLYRSLSAARLSEVQKELAALEDQLSPLLMKYKQEKERLDTIRRLQNKRQELLVALEMAEQRQDLARIAGGCRLGFGSPLPRVQGFWRALGFWVESAAAGTQYLSHPFPPQNPCRHQVRQLLIVH